MTFDTGYDGQKSDERVPSPSLRDWKVETVTVGTSESESVGLAIILDGEKIGYIELPDNDHVRWFRERVQVQRLHGDTNCKCSCHLDAELCLECCEGIISS